MRNCLYRAQTMLETMEIEKDVKLALQSALQMVLAEKEKYDEAVSLYERLFRRDEPHDGAAVMEGGEDACIGEIYTAVLFARVCELCAGKDYRTFKGSVDFITPLFRFLKRNKARYGHYYLMSSYRNWCYRYAFPCCVTLGRLAFEMTTFSFPFEVCDIEGNCTPLSIDESADYKKVLKQGDPVLAVHIPGNDKLTQEAVEESFALAEEFFTQYFPKYHSKAYVCSSWLLDTGLSQFLPENSNILKFQKFFNIVSGPVNDFSLYKNIFGLEQACPLEQLVPTNSFQKKVLEYVKDGGLLYSGKGYILS